MLCSRNDSSTEPAPATHLDGHPVNVTLMLCDMGDEPFDLSSQSVSPLVSHAQLRAASAYLLTVTDWQFTVTQPATMLMMQSRKLHCDVTV